MKKLSIKILFCILFCIILLILGEKTVFGYGANDLVIYINDLELSHENIENNLYKITQMSHINLLEDKNKEVIFRCVSPDKTRKIFWGFSIVDYWDTDGTEIKDYDEILEYEVIKEEVGEVIIKVKGKDVGIASINFITTDENTNTIYSTVSGTADFHVLVSKEKIEGPTKKDYKVGELLDLTGLKYSYDMPVHLNVYRNGGLEMQREKGQITVDKRINEKTYQVTLVTSAPERKTVTKQITVGGQKFRDENLGAYKITVGDFETNGLLFRLLKGAYDKIPYKLYIDQDLCAVVNISNSSNTDTTKTDTTKTDTTQQSDKVITAGEYYKYNTTIETFNLRSEKDTTKGNIKGEGNVINEIENGDYIKINSVDGIWLNVTIVYDKNTDDGDKMTGYLYGNSELKSYLSKVNEKDVPIKDKTDVEKDNLKEDDVKENEVQSKSIFGNFIIQAMQKIKDSILPFFKTIFLPKINSILPQITSFLSK